MAKHGGILSGYAGGGRRPYFGVAYHGSHVTEPGGVVAHGRRGVGHLE